MKRMLTILISIAVVTALCLGILPAMAKPDKNANNSNNEVKFVGNGFPSGPHYNLNIHGKKDGFTCPDPNTDNSSVFIPLEETVKIEYLQNKGKKSDNGNLDQLIIHDNCGFVDDDGDGVGEVKIQLPYEADGYYVYARILGKPNNNPNNEPSEVILWPNEFIEYCDNVSENDTSCDQALLPIGLIVGDDVFGLGDNETFQRFDPDSPVKGKGRSLAVEITRMFEYSGVVADNVTDIATFNGTDCSGNLTAPEPDGILDDCDVPNSGNATAIVQWFTDNISGFPAPSYYDATTTNQTCNGYVFAVGDGSGDVDTIGEWLMFLADLWTYTSVDSTILEAADNPLWSYPVRVEFYCKEFMLNIADLVLIGQDLQNKNTRLLQIRFYPVDSTTFPHGQPE